MAASVVRIQVSSFTSCCSVSPPPQIMFVSGRTLPTRLDFRSFNRPLKRESEKLLNFAILMVVFILLVVFRVTSSPETQHLCSFGALFTFPFICKRKPQQQNTPRRRDLLPPIHVVPLSVRSIDTCEMRVCSPRNFPDEYRDEIRDEIVIPSPRSDLVGSPSDFPCSNPESPTPGSIPSGPDFDACLSDFGVEESDRVRVEGMDSELSKCGAHMVYIDDDSGKGDAVGVFKPVDEGLGDDAVGTSSPHRSGVSVGDSSVREIGVYSLDHNNFSGVPLTRGVHLTVNDTLKKGSIQKFVPNMGSSEDFGDSRFSVDSVHRIGILDVRIFNMDRHLGNMIVVDGQNDSKTLDLVPIDHGLCLPDWRYLEEATFDWLTFAQTKIPFSEATRSYVRDLSVENDAYVLGKLGIAPDAVFTNVLCTVFLKQCVEAGLNLFQIGSLMSRDYLTDDPSVFENIVADILPENAPLPFELDFLGDREGFGVEMCDFLAKFQSDVDKAIRENVVKS